MCMHVRAHQTTEQSISLLTGRHREPLIHGGRAHAAV